MLPLATCTTARTDAHKHAHVQACWHIVYNCVLLTINLEFHPISSLPAQVAVITGGGSGIGLATAHLFAQRGAKTYVLDLNMEAAAAAADSINADEAAVAGGGSAVAVECDVTKAESVNAAFNRVASENDGTLDCLVNNAGIGSVGTVLETTAEDMAKLTAVNINGVFHCLQAGVRIMKEKGNGGAIINMGACDASLTCCKSNSWCEYRIDLLAHWPRRSLLVLHD